MRFTSGLLGTAFTLGFTFLPLAAPLAAQEQSLLSTEIRQALDAGGLEAARQRFDELYPSQQEQYQADFQGMSAIATEYMQAGDHQTGQALAEMAVTIVTGQTQAAMNAQTAMPVAEALAAAMDDSDPMPPPAPESGSPRETPEPRFEAGPSRTDLGRFTGLYADPAQPDEKKAIWAAEGCDGRLVTGTTWGDASPWWMRSVSDGEFEYEDSWTQITMSFEAAAGAPATGMTHDRADLLPSPLVRIGPLPEGWVNGCVQPPEVCTTC